MLSGLIDEIRAEHGRLDFLVNNAMHVGWSAISETSLENFQQEDGSVDITAALLPYMGGITRLEPAS